MRFLTIVAAVLLVLACGCGSAEQPAKPADFLRIEEFAGRTPDNVRYLPWEDALLLGPHFGRGVEWAVTTDSLSGEDTRRLGLGDSAAGFRAADGHEFVVVYLSSDTRYVHGRWGEDDDADLAAEIRIGDRVRKLTALPEPGDLIVASVPRSQPVALTVVDDGVPLSIDLRRGRPVGDAHRTRTTQVNESYDGSGQVSTPAGRALDVHVAVDSVSVEPYVPGLGWAATGRRWLRVGFGQVTSTAVEPDAGAPYIGFLVDPVASFELTAGDARIRPTAGRLFNTTRPLDQHAAIFDVPGSFRGGRLTISPDGPMFAYDGSSALTRYTEVTKAPQCGGDVICLGWERRPEPGSVELTLR